MKESKLKEMIKKISKELEESDIINKCYSLAVKEGKGTMTEHSSHTNLNYTFKGRDLEIHLNDGFSEMGGGRIEVNYKGKRVLYGDRGQLEASTKRDLLVQAEQFAILEYHKGRWESRIAQILNAPLEKPKQEKPKDLELPKETINAFNEKYKPLSSKRENNSPECADDRLEKVHAREYHEAP